jgi:hypothetical protein
MEIVELPDPGEPGTGEVVVSIGVRTVARARIAPGERVVVLRASPSGEGRA